MSRGPYVLRACDAVLTSALPAPTGHEHPRSGSYERMRAAVAAASRIAPAAVGHLRVALATSLHLPFAAAEAEVVGFGAASTVFLIRPAGGDRDGPLFVLKVLRKSLGRCLGDAVELVSRARAMHEAVAAQYDGCAVVVPAQFLVLQGPLLGRPVAACIQPYVRGRKRDFPALFGDERLPRLIRESGSLSAQFRAFAERTLAMAEREHRCIDLVGGENLLLVQDGGAPRLQLIDYGIHDFRLLESKAPRLLGRARDRLVQLRRLYQRVFGRSAPDPLPHPRGMSRCSLSP